MRDVVKLNRRSGKYRSDWLQSYKEDLSILGLKCERCGSTSNLDRHHVIHKSKGGSDSCLNLMILCKNCHKLEHRRR